jgi:hypothetical protein
MHPPLQPAEKHRFVASRGLEQLVHEAGDRELAPELLPMVKPIPNAFQGPC